ncbi:MAG: MFS transporter [Aggregatilineales bacterium]
MSTLHIKQTGDAPALTPDSEQSALRALLTSKNFVLLWLGETISLIGDQFYMIALPWLILQMTGDPFAMGMVLAIGGIPRALFMLVGGALTDRFTPRSVMLVSNMLRMVIVMVLSLTILTGTIQVWMIYIFSLLFGLMDAFFFPAQNAIVPNLVKPEQLQTANAIVMMTQQLSLFGGPVLAGAMIALLGSSQTVETELTGIGWAFGIDALTFLASAITLYFIRVKRKAKSKNEDESENVIQSMMTGLRYVRQNPSLRSVFALIIFANMLISAPMTIGIPVLADVRLPEGAAAFGMIMSAFGGGSLLGMALGGGLPRPRDERLGIILIGVWSTMGIGVILMGLATSTLLAAAIGGVMGIANGYVVIVFITWLQSSTPEIMIGRMMSLFLFSTVGLAPIANAVMGAAIGWNLTVAFAGSGILMTVFVLGAMLLTPALRHMHVELFEA